MSGNGIDETWEMQVLDFTRQCQIIFQSNCTRLALRPALYECLLTHVLSTLAIVRIHHFIAMVNGFEVVSH